MPNARGLHIALYNGRTKVRLIKKKIRVKKLSKLRMYILTAMILHNFWLQTSDGYLKNQQGRQQLRDQGLALTKMMTQKNIAQFTKH